MNIKRTYNGETIQNANGFWICKRLGFTCLSLNDLKAELDGKKPALNYWEDRARANRQERQIATIRKAALWLAVVSISAASGAVISLTIGV